MKFFAGWIISSWPFASLIASAWVSSSAQIAWRCPVLASITTIGALAFEYWAMSVIGTAPLAAMSIPGT
ncbi:unannotated protein [freshwater metagenome]|uniref:Unannotated protein n=1 Tax=freshwater metagenome TaxID=449393 RepID=A0A6J6A1X0_9ZZZZ